MKGRTNFFILKLADSNHAEAISKAVDAMFENSPDETKTQTEKDFNLGFVKQIGDIGSMVRWILFAVFFTLLLVVGNTMAQSVRERIPETGECSENTRVQRRQCAGFRTRRIPGAVPVRRPDRTCPGHHGRRDGGERHGRAVPAAAGCLWCG